MKKLMLFILMTLGAYARVISGQVPLVQTDFSASKGGDLLVSSQMIQNILHYQTWGELFVYLQVHWFRLLFFSITAGILIVFLLHYFIIGPKKFLHEGKGIYVYSIFKRLVHWCAAFAFILVIPTGFMMVFGKEFGGGNLVLTARYIHSIGTVLFVVSVIPMFLMWLIPMLPTFDDIKWLFMLGGYLTKKKVVVPAGQFNAGQKMWFWVAMLGGIVMIGTGVMMYFEDFHLSLLDSFKLDQIDLLRVAAITHNFLGLAVAALFITHLYMSLFAIKGSLDSMIDGHKSEDEVRYMHSSFYKKLKKEGKI
ncbi:MAG: formate dehydrogenase subunit gamma [Campylobacteraceae bacterium]|nr:formate dehydrogenase subunit gamma [Campylobacteraceae bacterium]